MNLTLCGVSYSHNLASASRISRTVTLCLLASADVDRVRSTSNCGPEYDSASNPAQRNERANARMHSTSDRAQTCNKNAPTLDMDWGEYGQPDVTLHLEPLLLKALGGCNRRGAASLLRWRSAIGPSALLPLTHSMCTCASGVRPAQNRRRTTRTWQQPPHSVPLIGSCCGTVAAAALPHGRCALLPGKR